MFVCVDKQMRRDGHLRIARAVSMAERKYRHPQVNLRLPEELKEKISAMAAINGRSANNEMVEAIKSWVGDSEEPDTPQTSPKSHDEIPNYQGVIAGLNETVQQLINLNQAQIQTVNLYEEQVRLIRDVVLKETGFDIDTIMHPNKKPT